MSKEDYAKKNDTELLELYNNLMYSKPVKPVPLALVKEVHKRKLIKTYTGTYHS